MLAISERKTIEEAVTDVLVTRGNWDVVNSVANNDGARLSDFGFLRMIQRAEGDSHPRRTARPAPGHPEAASSSN